MLSIPFDQLILKQQRHFKSDSKPEIDARGYDTETINGRAELITDSEGNQHFPSDMYSILDWLTRKANRGSIGFFFNLKYDFQAVLKWLPPEQWVIIYHTGLLDLGDYILKYIPKKMLLIKKLSGTTKEGKNKYRQFKFYDIAQYYRTSLDKAAKEYLGEGKADHGFDLSKLTLTDIASDEMIFYCKRDSVLTKRLALHWIKICNKQGLYTSNFCSPASISGRYFSSVCGMPSINKMFESEKKIKMLEYAWNACSGAFISCFKRGYFEEAHEYDICSAYPSEMSKFPDMRGGYLTFVKNSIPGRAYLGWIKCNIEIDYNLKEAYHPPFPVLRNKACNYYPVGNFEQYITLAEYNAYKSYFKIDIIDGVYWTPDRELVFTFDKIINDLYTRRCESKDGNVNFFIKIILNGIYGKFLEKHRITDPEDKDNGMYVSGNFFNPFIASYILAGSRQRIFDLLVTVPNDNILAVFTDSVLVKKPLPIPKIKKLGAWGYEQSGDAVLIGCGVYSINAPGKMKTRIRGFNTGGRINLFTEAAKNVNKIDIPIKNNVSPLSSVIQRIPERMNFLLDGVKSININFDTKRVWHGEFKNSLQLLEKNIDSDPYFHGL